MMVPVMLISDIAAGSVRVAVYLAVVFRLLTAKRPGKNRVVTALSGNAVIVAAGSVMGLPDVCRVGLETIWMAVCAGCFQGADTRMSLFIGIFYEIAVSFWQFLIAAWAGICFHSAAFLDHGTSSGQMAVWLFHLLLSAVLLYLMRHPDLEGKGAFRSVSALTVAGFIAVVTLSQQTILLFEKDTLYMWTILSVVLMMSVLVFHMNRQYEMEKELARLKSEQAGLLERDYMALNRVYAMNAKLFHDFHNHISVLRRLLAHDKPEEAMAYLDELQEPVREMTDTVWTGDETVDYLCYPQLVGTIQLSGGRRHVKKYIWSF